jgi:hypothetical protein
MFQMKERSTAERLQQGRAAVEARDLERAREILEPLVEEEPGNAEAWLWLSGAHSSPAEMARCLRQVLRIEPENEDAVETLAWLEAKYGAAAIMPVESPTGAPTSSETVQPALVRDEIDETPDPLLFLPETSLGARSPPESQARFRAPRQSAPSPVRSTTPKSHLGSRIYPVSPYAKPFDRQHLQEVGLLVAGVGALLGLLRLAGQLRPGTLLLIRGSDGPISLAGALVVAAASALLHGAALVVAWQILGRTVAAARKDRPGDVADRLGRLAIIFWPGYAVLGALLLVMGSLGAGERRWVAVVALVWIILLGSTVVAARRLAALLEAFRLRGERPGVMLVRIVLPAFLIALAGLGVAGLVVQRLLTAI